MQFPWKIFIQPEESSCLALKSWGLRTESLARGNCAIIGLSTESNSNQGPQALISDILVAYKVSLSRLKQDQALASLNLVHQNSRHPVWEHIGLWFFGAVIQSQNLHWQRQNCYWAPKQTEMEKYWIWALGQIEMWQMSWKDSNSCGDQSFHPLSKLSLPPPPPPPGQFLKYHNSKDQRCSSFQFCGAHMDLAYTVDIGKREKSDKATMPSSMELCREKWGKQWQINMIRTNADWVQDKRRWKKFFFAVFFWLASSSCSSYDLPHQNLSRIADIDETCAHLTCT